MSEESVHVDGIKKNLVSRKKKNTIDVEEVVGGSRRSWTKAEEETLIVSLDMAIDANLLAENGFKSRYLTFLEKAMHAKLPGTGLRAVPHISSCITVWRKQHSFLSSLLKKSGIGFNDEKFVVECDQEQWDIACKVEVGWKKKKDESWPFYHDWQRIFGKDRATDSRAKDFGDTSSSKSKPTESGSLVGSMQHEFDYVLEDQVTSKVSKYVLEDQVTSKVSKSALEDQVTSKPSKRKRMLFSNDDTEFLSTFNKLNYVIMLNLVSLILVVAWEFVLNFLINVVGFGMK